MKIWIFRFYFEKIYIYILQRFFCRSVYVNISAREKNGLVENLEHLLTRNAV